jgi:hypothetical protein
VLSEESRKDIEAHEYRGNDGGVVSSGWLRRGMWRCSAAVGFDVEMFEEFTDDPRLGCASSARSTTGSLET